MDEKGFWAFLENLWQKGRAQQIICTTDGIGIPEQSYLQGHALLPKEYNEFSDSDIVKMGRLLFEEQVKLKTKEAVMLILAHQPSEVALTILTKYNFNPDKGMEFFAQMALEECAMWNE